MHRENQNRSHTHPTSVKQNAVHVGTQIMHGPLQATWPDVASTISSLRSTCIAEVRLSLWFHLDCAAHAFVRSSSPRIKDQMERLCHRCGMTVWTMAETVTRTQAEMAPPVMKTALTGWRGHQRGRLDSRIPCFLLNVARIPKY